MNQPTQAVRGTMVEDLLEMLNYQEVTKNAAKDR
jgi:hypothetical protein